MISEKKIRANRENAGASTGPKTSNGRARSARNALRYGLSLPIQSNSVWSEEVERLACKIAGNNATEEIKYLARQVAEAQIELCRVRYVRHQLLYALSHRYDSELGTREKLPGRVVQRKVYT